jgi:hypothetical protein
MIGLDTKYYQKVFSFSNGFGASVVCKHGTYGSEFDLFEVAVLRDGDICYNSGLTTDTIGWLDFQEVADLLKKIEALPAGYVAPGEEQ